MRVVMALMAFCAKLLATLCFFLSWLAYKPATNADERPTTGFLPARAPEATVYQQLDDTAKLADSASASASDL